MCVCVRVCVFRDEKKKSDASDARRGIAEGPRATHSGFLSFFFFAVFCSGPLTDDD